MAGPAGFEPANDGTKTRCLTTWRRSNIFSMNGYILSRNLDFVKLNVAVFEAMIDSTVVKGGVE